MAWISVDDWKPAPDTLVVGTEHFCYFAVVAWQPELLGGSWFEPGRGETLNVTHWAPIPDAPDQNKPAPSHEEIMTNWWFNEGQRSWGRVTCYDELTDRYQVNIGYSGAWRDPSWFCGKKSAILPPGPGSRRDE
jgi:hypothetical protein